MYTNSSVGFNAKFKKAYRNSKGCILSFFSALSCISHTVKSSVLLHGSLSWLPALLLRLAHIPLSGALGTHRGNRWGSGDAFRLGERAAQEPLSLQDQRQVIRQHCCLGKLGGGDRSPFSSASTTERMTAPTYSPIMRRHASVAAVHSDDGIFPGRVHQCAYTLKVSREWARFYKIISCKMEIIV